MCNASNPHWILWLLGPTFLLSACTTGSGGSHEAGNHAPDPGRACRILIVTGEDYPGHLWRETTPILANALREDERLAVTVATRLDVLREPGLGTYDAVVLHFKNYDPEMPGRIGFEALRDYVLRGGGLVLVHFACGAFQEFVGEFETFAGRVWDPALRGHDPHGAFTVEIVGADHEVTRGLQAFETTDELYTCLAGTTPIRVLAQSHSKVDGSDHPMAFVLEPEAGRVFHTVLGHDARALQVPEVGELLRRGTAWSAGLPASPHE